MNKKEVYNQTMKTYKNLGDKYLLNIANLVPSQLFDFMDMLPSGGAVLDVGCAGGRDAREFVQEGFGVVGIDLVDDFLNKAEKDVPRAKFLKMDLLNLQFPKNTFDGIWASAVLVHIDKTDIQKALTEFNKVLKQDGKLFIAVKMGDGSSFSSDKLSKEKRFFVYFSREEIEEMLRLAGFQIKNTFIVEDDAKRKDLNWIRIIAQKI